MSGAFSTAKLACSTLPLWSLPTLAIWPRTSPPSLRLSLICAVVLMSIRVRRTVASLAWTLAPPTRSDAFSRFAIQRAALLDAPCSLSANTEAPRASGGSERVGMDRDEQVGLDPARLLDALVQRHEEVGVARQHRAHVRVAFRRSRRSMRDRQDDVLLVQSARPAAPGSSPPWPGSTATTTRRSIFAWAVGGSAGAAGNRAARRPAAGPSAAPTRRTAAPACRARSPRRRRRHGPSPRPASTPPRRRRRRGR